MRRLVPGFVLAFVVALTSVVLMQLPAHACKCVASDIARDAQRADAVFTGTVVSVQKPPSGNSPEGDGPTGEGNKADATGVITIQVEADRSWKGHVPTKAELSTAANSAACGIEDLEADKKYLFFAQSDGAKLTINSCGGTAPLTAELGATISKLLGPGKDTAADEEPPAAPSADREVVEGSEPAAFTRIAAPGGALVVVGVLGLLVLRRFTGVRQS
ncbi:hypothetical protein [Nocardioides speluncae]|uniref:hypothetical protein n=1 Tax=Nocardioides speluncae TaxID=2670337 RepID=UPI0012B17845|nr:hypothetical protein [Nocardioides speluncae]